MRAVRWWLWTLGVSSVACGESIRHGERNLPTETPFPTAGTSGNASMTGGASGSSSAAGRGGTGGLGGSPVDAGAVNDPDAGVDDLPAVRVDDIPPCGGPAPISLADEARGDGAIAIDDDNVYYVGLRGVSAVPKAGGAARVLGPADGTDQIAVDDDSVYFGGRSFWRVPKSGGDVTLLLDGQVLGVVGSSEHVYFTNWGIVPTSLQSWSKTGGFEMVERFGGQLYVPHLVADDAFVYVAEGDTAALQDVERVRTSDGSVEALMQASIVRGIAVGGGNLYVSEEATHSVKVAHLADLGTETVLHLADYPTGLAADDDHAYLNLQAIMPGGTKYHGHLVRLDPRGNDLCELSTSIDYGPAVAVDATSIYWIGERHVWSVAK